MIFDSCMIPLYMPSSTCARWFHTEERVGRDALLLNILTICSQAKETNYGTTGIVKTSTNIKAKLVS